jgi:DNA-binding protein YbaB
LSGISLDTGARTRCSPRLPTLLEQGPTIAGVPSDTEAEEAEGGALTPGARSDGERALSPERGDRENWFERTSGLLASLQAGAQHLRMGAEEAEQRRRNAAERELDTLGKAAAMASALQSANEGTRDLEERGSDKRGLITIDLASSAPPRVRVDPKLLRDPTPERLAAVIQEAISTALQNLELSRLRTLAHLAETDPTLAPISDSARARLAELEGTIQDDGRSGLGSTPPRATTSGNTKRRLAP